MLATKCLLLLGFACPALALTTAKAAQELSALETARHAVAEGDADEDGALNKPEFGEIIQTDKGLQNAVFGALDLDRDGKVDAEPFEQLDSLPALERRMNSYVLCINCKAKKDKYYYFTKGGPEMGRCVEKQELKKKGMPNWVKNVLTPVPDCSKTYPEGFEAAKAAKEAAAAAAATVEKPEDTPGADDGWGAAVPDPSWEAEFAEWLEKTKVKEKDVPAPITFVADTQPDAIPPGAVEEQAEGIAAGCTCTNSVCIECCKCVKDTNHAFGLSIAWDATTCKPKTDAMFKPGRGLIREDTIARSKADCAKQFP